MTLFSYDPADRTSVHTYSMARKAEKLIATGAQRFHVKPVGGCGTVEELQARWAALPTEDKALRAVIAKHCNDTALTFYLIRDLMVTPYAGAYGVAGYVIAVNGSPAKATIIVHSYDTNALGEVIVLSPWRKTKTITDPATLAVVSDFLDAWKRRHGKAVVPQHANDA